MTSADVCVFVYRVITSSNFVVLSSTRAALVTWLVNYVITSRGCLQCHVTDLSNALRGLEREREVWCVAMCMYGVCVCVCVYVCKFDYQSVCLINSDVIC